MSEYRNNFMSREGDGVGGETAPIRAILVGVVTRDDEADEVEIGLDELARLLDTAGGEVFARVVQNKATPDPRTLIGSGKVKELADLCRNNDIGLVIFDCDLTPVQIRNLEDDIRGGDTGMEIRVIDRSMLILDIFALHAVTSEGKLQVELAQLQYSAPRLTGHGTEMSRLGGGIGTRGPGESKLESDRRHLELTLGGDGVEGEDIQDQHGAVDDPQIHGLVTAGGFAADIVLQIADLDGGQVAVKDHQTDRVVAAQLGQLLHLARADEGAGVGSSLVLHHPGEDLAAGGVQEAGQLVEADLYFIGIILAGDHTDKDGLDGAGGFVAGGEGVFIFGHIGSPFKEGLGMLG